MNDVIALVLCAVALGFCYWLVVVKCYIIYFPLYKRSPDIHLCPGRIGKLMFDDMNKCGLFKGDFVLDKIDVRIELNDMEILGVNYFGPFLENKVIIDARFETCHSEAMIVLK